MTARQDIEAALAAEREKARVLREALDLIVQWDAAGLALCEHHFEKARAALTQTGAEK